LESDVGIETKTTISKIEHPNKLEPYLTTAMIGIGGTINLMFLMSFEDEAIKALVHKFTYGEVAEDEIAELQDSVACEIANTVLGNALVNLPNQGAGVTITPPIMRDSCKAISNTKNSIITLSTINTNYGHIILAIVGQEITNIK
jgi:CheY-specific phosphatase CheX